MHPFQMHQKLHLLHTNCSANTVELVKLEMLHGLFHADLYVERQKYAEQFNCYSEHCHADNFEANCWWYWKSLMFMVYHDTVTV